MRLLMVAILTGVLCTRAEAQSVAPKDFAFYDTYFKFTCIPEMDYFSITTFDSWKRAASEDGAFDTEKMWKQHSVAFYTGDKIFTYECAAGNGIKIEFRIGVNKNDAQIGWMTIQDGDYTIANRYNIIDYDLKLNYIVYQEKRWSIKDTMELFTYNRASTLILSHTFRRDTPECERIFKTLIPAPHYLTRDEYRNAKSEHRETACYDYQRETIEAKPIEH